MVLSPCSLLIAQFKPNPASTAKIAQDSTGFRVVGGAVELTQNPTLAYVSDNATATQIAAYIQNHDVVYLPEMEVNSTLVLVNLKNKTVIGAGEGKTIFSVGSGNSLSFDKVDSFKISGITFSGGMALFDTCRYALIENCEFLNSPTSNGVNARQSTEIRFYNCRFADNNQHGLEFGTGSTRLSVQNSLFERNANKGMESWEFGRFHSIDNNVFLNNDHGVFLYKTDYSSVTNNVFINDTTESIIVEESDGCLIIGNLGTNAQSGSQIFLRIVANSDSTIVGNNFWQGYETGESILNNITFGNKLGDFRRDASGNFYFQNGSQSNALLFTTSGNVLTSTSNLIFQIDANNVSTTRTFEVKNNDNFTGGNLLFSINESGNVSATGRITTYNNVSTQGAGVPYVVARGVISDAENDDLTITSYLNPAGADRTYRINADATVTGFSTGVVGVELVYTDDGGTSRTRNLFANLGGSTTGFSRNSTGILACFPEIISVDANTTITVRTHFTGSAVANFTALIERLD
jgi:parallel beta-helix repeat protein